MKPIQLNRSPNTVGEVCPEAPKRALHPGPQTCSHAPNPQTNDPSCSARPENSNSHALHTYPTVWVESRRGASTDAQRRLVVAELQFFTRNREFLAIYLSTRSGLEWTLKHDFGEAVSRKYAAYLEMVTAIIRRGIDEGELRAAPPADLAYALVGMVNSLVFRWVAEDDPQPLGPKADWLVELMSRAAGADRGCEDERITPR